MFCARSLMPHSVEKCGTVVAGLLDWANLRDGEQDVPYSRAMAETLLTDPQFRAFYEACVWACSVVGDGAADANRADAKN